MAQQLVAGCRHVAGLLWRLCQPASLPQTCAQLLHGAGLILLALRRPCLRVQENFELIRHDVVEPILLEARDSAGVTTG